MSLLQINTAIPLAEPLLDQQQDHERSHTGNNSNIGNKNNKNNNKDERRAELSKSEVNSRIRFVVLGALTGFFIQVVSLGAYAVILVKYKNYSLVGDINTNQTTDFLSMDGFFQPTTTTTTHNNANTSIQDAFLYTALSVLTQIDLVVYVFIWVAFTCTMTRNGMACIRASFFSSPDSRGDNVRRRYVFVLGVCFLVGLVFGAFAAWSAVDVYLGYPIPFQPIMATVTIDLALCYLMLWCFDLGGRRHRNTNTNTSNNNNNNNNNGEEMKSESESQYDADDNDDDTIPGMYC